MGRLNREILGSESYVTGVCIEACLLLVTHCAKVTVNKHFFSRPFGEVITVLLQVARTLQAIHKRGFIHNHLSRKATCVSLVSRAGPVAAVTNVGLARILGTCEPYNKLQDRTFMRSDAPELLELLEAGDVVSLAVMIEDMEQLQNCCTNHPLQQALTIWVQDALRPAPAERPGLAEVVVLLETP